MSATDEGQTPADAAHAGLEALGEEWLGALRERLGVVELEQDVAGIRNAVEEAAEDGRERTANLNGLRDDLSNMEGAVTGAIEEAARFIHNDRVISTLAKRPEQPVPAALMLKIADVWTVIERVPKTGYNSFHRYHYATESDVADTLRSELGKRGVVIMPQVVEWRREDHTPTERGRPQWLWHVTVDFTFIDAESGESWVSRGWPGVGIDSEDKGIYKAMTGAAKYALMKSFMVSTGDDPEEDTRPAQTGRDAPARRQARAGREETFEALTEQQMKMLHAKLKESGGSHDDLVRLVAYASQGRYKTLRAVPRRSVDGLLPWLDNFNRDAKGMRAEMASAFVDHPDWAPDAPAEGEAAAQPETSVSADVTPSEPASEPAPMPPGAAYDDDDIPF